MFLKNNDLKKWFFQFKTTVSKFHLKVIYNHKSFNKSWNRMFQFWGWNYQNRLEISSKQCQPCSSHPFATISVALKSPRKARNKIKWIPRIANKKNRTTKVRFYSPLWIFRFMPNHFHRLTIFGRVAKGKLEAFLEKILF